jgi:hypothetical protein
MPTVRNKRDVFSVGIFKHALIVGGVEGVGKQEGNRYSTREH